MKRILTLCSLLIVLLMGCAQPQQLQYKSVQNFRVRNLSLSRPEIGMDIQFYNPNNFALSLKDANIDIFINDQYIGKAALTQQFEVPQMSNFNMPVAMTADLKNVFSNALLVLFNQAVDVKIQGNVKAGKGLFVNVPINYQGRHKLNIY